MPSVVAGLRWVVSLLLGLGMAVLIRWFVLAVFVVRSISMTPTLLPGDRVLVLKFWYRLASPKPGQVIVFKADQTTDAGKGPDRSRRIGPGRLWCDGYTKVLIKRVAGGDNSLILTAAADDRAHDSQNSRSRDFLVLGDNLAVSRDSRSLGPIRRKDALGRAVLIVWPLRRSGTLKSSAV